MSRPDVRPGLVDAPVAPRHAFGWVALIYAIATLLLAWPALFGGYLFGPDSDQYIAGYAFREFQAQYMREHGGAFPLWNPYLFAGMPYIAAMHGDIFYPTFLLRLILPTDAAMTWSFIAHVWLAGIFTYGFLRAAGVGFGGAVVGGLAYMLSGPIASYVSPGHDGKLYVSALLPLALWCLHRGIRDGRSWATGALALVIGLAVLSPHPQLLQYMLLACGVYALWAAFGGGNDDVRLERPVALRRLALAFGAVLLGGLIGAVQFWPVFEYVDWSPRAGGAGWEHAISYSMPPEELLNTYLPEFTGILNGYWGRNGIHFHSEYVGGAVLLLAGAAFGAAGRTVRRSFVGLWAGVLAVGVLWILGGHTPFYRLVYALVPGTEFFRAPSTMMFVPMFAVAVLAGIGAERVLARQVSRRYLVGWAIVALVVAVLATTGGLTNLAASIADPSRMDAVFANQGPLLLGAWRALLVVIAIIAVVTVVQLRRVPARVGLWLLLAVISIDLWSVLRHYWTFSESADVIFASDPAIDYLKQQEQPGRVFTFQTIRGARRDVMLSYDGLMHHRQRLVYGYHGNHIGRYGILSGETEGMEGIITQIGNPNFWHLANIRWMYTDMAEPPFEGAVRVAGPATNAAGSIVYLYRLPGDNPAAWVTPAIVKAPDNAVLATLREPAFDVRSAALFDTSAAVQGVQLARAPRPLDLPVTVERWDPGHIVLQLSSAAPAGSALMVSENYYPGWLATADSTPAAIGRAGFSMIGVALPEGARRVELTFTSPRYERGKVVTLAAIAAALVLMAAGMLLDRRRRV